MHLTLHQERVSPSGSMMSIGILNQLGRPNLDTLAVLVREAVQNSWDARLADDVPVFFGINGWTMDEQQRQYLAEHLFRDTPPVSSLPLAALLQSAESINALVLYDRGTVGLGGSTRADDVPTDGESSNFVNFLRNVGQPAARDFSGGTYGYGKAAFYRASQARAICVYSRSRFQGQLETRLMAAALGEPFTEGRTRYTGRFWWGIPVSEPTELVDPLFNQEADAAAAAIGMPLFEGDECGTNVMILEPHFGERTPLQAVNLMAENILWYFWPKLMLQKTGYPAINVDVVWQGHKIDIPSPETYPPLRGFVQAMYDAKGKSAVRDENPQHRIRVLSSVRPKQVLGILALQEFPRSDETAFDTGVPSREGNFAALHHHTALMRQPELVVKYLPGQPLEDGTKGYAGVFITDQDLDSVFASAEPPTHDDWAASSLEQRHHRTFVNQALKQIEREMNDFATLQNTEEQDIAENYHPSGTVARHLGSLLFKRTAPPETGSFLLYPKQKMSMDIPEFTPQIDSFSLPPLIPIHSTNDDFNALADKVEAFSVNGSRNSVNVAGGQNVSISKASKANGRAQLFYTAQSLIVTESGEPAVKVDFRIEHSPYSSGTYVRITARVVLDGNTREAEPPVGQGLPRTMYWSDPLARRYPSADELFIPVQISDICSVVVSVPGNVMLHIELNAAPAG